MKTILIADDNPDFVDTQAALLASDYQVAKAYSVPQALDTLDERDDIAAVVSDVRMPSYDGYDLLRVMRHRWPAIPVILVTGFPIDDDDRSLPPGAIVLEKPYDIADLKRVIREQLAQRDKA